MMKRGQTIDFVTYQSHNGTRFRLLTSVDVCKSAPVAIAPNSFEYGAGKSVKQKGSDPSLAGARWASFNISFSQVSRRELVY